MTASSPHLTWRTSTFSNDQGDCVEVAWADSTLVRDSKNPGGGRLAVSTSSWHALIDTLG